MGMCVVAGLEPTSRHVHTHGRRHNDELKHASWHRHIPRAHVRRTETCMHMCPTTPVPCMHMNSTCPCADVTSSTRSHTHSCHRPPTHAVCRRLASDDFQAHTNSLPLFDQRKSDGAGGDPNIRYYHSYWRLSEGQVLRIRARPPPCRCWNFRTYGARCHPDLYRHQPPRASPLSLRPVARLNVAHVPDVAPSGLVSHRGAELNNHWMESLDYRYHTVHTNSTLARPDDDGSGWYTLLVCADNPNTRGAFYGNWYRRACTPHACGDTCPRAP